MLLSKTVIMKWHPINKKWYEDKKYLFTKMGDEFKVKVEDLTKGSNVKVNVKCDCEDCKNPYLKPMPWYRYTNHVRKDDKYYCNKCSQKLYAIENGRKTKLKNGKSFYDWCYENLSKEEADEIITRWDYELNINKEGNIITPKDISFSSNGFDKKGYWFKCLKYPEHKSELKNIKGFIKGQKGSLNCIQCNTIIFTHPYLIKYLKNKEDAYKYSYGSNKNIQMICPDCGYEKQTNINRIIKQCFACPKCGNGTSYPEKFMFNFLEQLFNNNFQTQLSKKDFKWCNKYKYDFYLLLFNCIIETHGLQHYEGGFERIKNPKKHIKTLKEIQENDKNKKEIAKNNGINNYIVLDCRKSDLEWIKNSIMQSELPNLLNFKEEDINWLKCHEYALSNSVKEVCNLWNNGFKSTVKIAELLKKDKTSIIRYLKQGTELGWCDYNPKEEIKKGCSMRKKKNNIKIICLTTNEIFDSIKEASIKYNIVGDSNLSKCCKGNRNYAGNLPDGTKLKWMYYDEYLKNN